MPSTPLRVAARVMLRRPHTRNRITAGLPLAPTTSMTQEQTTQRPRRLAKSFTGF